MSADLSSDGIAPEDWKPLHPLTYLPRVVGSIMGVVPEECVCDRAHAGR